MTTTASILFSGERLKAFPSALRTRVPTLISLIQHSTKNPSYSNQITEMNKHPHWQAVSLPTAAPIYIRSNLVDSIERKQWQPSPVLLPGKSHGRRSLVDCSPRGR